MSPLPTGKSYRKRQKKAKRTDRVWFPDYWIWEPNSASRDYRSCSHAPAMEPVEEPVPAEKSLPVVHCEIIQAVQGLGAVNVFVICLDKYGSEHNIIDRQFGLEFAQAVYLAREKAESGEADVAVLCSAKDRSFLAGADIEEELKFIGPDGTQRAFVDSLRLENILCDLESLPIPTLAVVNGTALGGGLELALACDFRIADAEHCHQLGLPEVKLGVLPGGGGCCRLPRLLGFRRSLNLLLSGQSLTAQKALKVGLVDHVMPKTETSVRTDSCGQRTYDYKWFSAVLTFVEHRNIGKRPFHVESREGLSAVECNLKVGEWTGVSEDTLNAKLAESWQQCEEKARKKYGDISSGKWCLIKGYLINLVFYILSLFTLWRRVGTRMPAPYVCLQTAFRCLYAGSWLEAMSMNALGFTMLASTAESKGLMGLFLLTRRLKKFALTYGLKVKERKPERFDKETTIIFVIVSKEGIVFSSAFIQSLLYSGVKVHVAAVGGNIGEKELQKHVEKHFSYAVKRGHMKVTELREKMGNLQFYETQVLKNLIDREKLGVIVNAAFIKDKKPVERLISDLRSALPKVVHLDITPGLQRGDDVVEMNVGDPRRKNTLCVEICPLSAKTHPEDLRITASFVSALGKIPILTPPSLSTSEQSLPSSLAHYLTAHYWALAARLVAGGGASVSAGQVDTWLLACGFSKAPFATMRELDTTYVAKITELGTRSGIDCAALQRKRFSKCNKWYSSVASTEASELFVYSLVSASLEIKQLYPNVPETAIDVLCVSGLVQFPPTEGGPCNYLARNGLDRIIRKLEILVAIPALREEAERVLSKLTQYKGDNLSSVVSVNDNEMVSEFQERKSELVVLSAAELRKVGLTRGLKNIEMFLYPLLFVILCSVVFLVSIAFGTVIFATPLSMLFHYFTQLLVLLFNH